MRTAVPRRLRAFGLVLATAAFVGAPSAHAGFNDLELLNLCGPPVPSAPGVLVESVPECRWVERDASGAIARRVEQAFDAEAETRFRSLMSEVGALFAPRLVIPADTLGLAGFQVSAELGLTTISRDRDYWDGVQGVNPQARTAARPDRWQTTVGVFLRKGIWLPLPAMEVGVGVVNLLDSQLVAFQGYAKLGIHEGFHRWPIPSIAARAGASHVTGTDQVRLDVFSFDFIASKAFGVLGTAKVEPFGGWSYMLINARSGRLDATPGCDATQALAATSAASLGPGCSPAQAGTTNDFAANFSFPDQDLIQRQRFFGGIKLKFAVFFVAGQYEAIPAGRSRDERKSNGARDTSQRQETVSLSGGFDF